MHRPISKVLGILGGTGSGPREGDANAKGLLHHPITRPFSAALRFWGIRIEEASGRTARVLPLEAGEPGAPGASGAAEPAREHAGVRRGREGPGGPYGQRGQGRTLISPPAGQAESVVLISGATQTGLTLLFCQSLATLMPIAKSLPRWAVRLPTVCKIALRLPAHTAGTTGQTPDICP